MKKLLVLLLAMVVVLPLFAGGAAEAETTSTKSSATEIASSDDITSWILEDNPESITGTVRWWMPFKGSQGMDALIEEFNQTYPNIKVELTTYNNNSDGKHSNPRRTG